MLNLIMIKSALFLATVAGVVAFSLAPLFLKGLPALAKNARSSATAVEDVRSSFSFSVRGVTRGVALMTYNCATCTGSSSRRALLASTCEISTTSMGVWNATSSSIQMDHWHSIVSEHTKSVHTPGGRGQGNALMVCKCETSTGEFMSEGALLQAEVKATQVVGMLATINRVSKERRALRDKRREKIVEIWRRVERRFVGLRYHRRLSLQLSVRCRAAGS